MQKYISHFLQLFCALAFIVYWSITMLYCSPNNYIRIKSGRTMHIFENFFFQRWSFFAPPPQSNDRLYYIFQDNGSTQQKVYEILGPIFNKKTEMAPFNSKEEAIDYILSGSISNIVDASRELVHVFELDYPDSAQLFHLSKAHKKIKDLGLEYPPMLTLYNYARIFAKNENISLDSTSFKIIIMQVQIPKFKDRHLLLDSAYRGKQEKIFETDYLPLNHNGK